MEKLQATGCLSRIDMGFQRRRCVPLAGCRLECVTPSERLLVWGTVGVTERGRACGRWGWAGGRAPG